MRKLLDWIADKLGYQRKFTFHPIQFPPITQELIDDGIAMDFPLEIIGAMKNEISPEFKMYIYTDDHGSPGKEISDDLFVVKE